MAATHALIEAKEPRVGYTFVAYVLEQHPFPRVVDGEAVVVQMDLELWRRLPVELLDRILLVLPASSQAKFRAVSKAWNSRLISGEFRKRSAALAFYAGRFVCGLAHKHAKLWGRKESTPASLSRYKVHKLNLDYLPAKFLELGSGRDPFFYTDFGSLHGGLIALDTRAPAEYAVCVVNLVSQTWRELVPPGCTPGSTVKAMSILPDERGGHSYKILVHRADISSLVPLWASRIFLLYCSKTDVWTIVAPDLGADRLHLQKKLVWAHILEKGAWNRAAQDAIPWPCAHGIEGGRLIQFNYIGMHSEGIFLVACPQMEQTLEVWKLNQARTRWDVVSTLPPRFRARVRPPTIADVLAWGRDPLDLLSIYSEALELGKAEATRLYEMESRKVTFHVGDAGVAGDLIYSRLFSNTGGLHDTHYVAYDIVQGEWDIIHSCRTAHADHSDFVHHRFFTPGPSIQP